MVDHVEWACGVSSIDAFIGRWRVKGHQWFAWMVGRYEEADAQTIPLGIKAVVHGFYVPPQLNDRDGFQLLDDPQASNLNILLEALDLQTVLYNKHLISLLSYVSFIGSCSLRFVYQ